MPPLNLDNRDTSVMASILASSAGAGKASITVATGMAVSTSAVPAAGLAGWLGFTKLATTVTVTTVSLPVAGLIAASGIVTWSGIKAYRAYRN